MTNVRRISIFVCFMLGFLVPFLLLTLVSGMESTGGGVAGDKGGAKAPQTTEAEVQTAQFLRGPGAMPQLTPVALPLLVGGDEETLWIVQSVLIPGTGDKSARPGFQMWAHETGKKQGGKDSWMLAQVRGKPPVFRGTPAVLVVKSSPGKSGTLGTPYLIMEDGQCVSFSLSELMDLPRMPWTAGEKAVTGVAGTDGLFVLTRGGIAGGGSISTTNPAATLPTTAPAVTGMALQPAAAIPAPSTQPLQPTVLNIPPPPTAPHTQPVDPGVWNLYRYHNSRWVVTTLGKVGEANWPGRSSAPVLFYQQDQLTLVWVDSTKGGVIRIRNLDYAKPKLNASNVVELALGENISRLQAVSIGPEFYLVWVAQVPESAGKTASGTGTLHGIAFRLAENATTHSAEARLVAPTFRKLKPLALGNLAPEFDINRDVAVTRTGNSLMAILTGKDGNKQSLLFDTSGTLLEGPLAIVPQNAAESQITESLVLGFMMALLSLALWQWRRRPMQPKLPKTLRPAYLQQRILAALIDLAFPILGVILAYGLYRDSRWMGLGTRWLETLRSLELWGKSPELLWILGIYIVHVTLGEIFFGRSIGKAILGIRVVAINGTRPEPLAIILRNMIRIVEIILTVLLFYLLISDTRQRLGDILSRTIVVRDATEDEPV